MILYPSSHKSYMSASGTQRAGQVWKMLPGGTAYTIVEVRDTGIECRHTSHEQVTTRARIYYDTMPSWEGEAWFWTCNFRHRVS